MFFNSFAFVFAFCLFSLASVVEGFGFFAAGRSWPAGLVKSLSGLCAFAFFIRLIFQLSVGMVFRFHVLSCSFVDPYHISPTVYLDAGIANSSGRAESVVLRLHVLFFDSTFFRIVRKRLPNSAAFQAVSGYIRTSHPFAVSDLHPSILSWSEDDQSCSLSQRRRSKISGFVCGSHLFRVPEFLMVLFFPSCPLYLVPFQRVVHVGILWSFCSCWGW